MKTSSEVLLLCENYRNTCPFTFLCNRVAHKDFRNLYDMFQDKEGNDFSLSYTADENGYRPIGEHLPTSPPIPPAIARALRYLATKTTPEPVTEPLEWQNLSYASLAKYVLPLIAWKTSWTRTWDIKTITRKHF